MRTLLTIISFFLLQVASEAVALSCSSFEDNFISECSSLGCGEILYVKEISAYAPCARKPSFAKHPDWAREVFEYEVKQEGSSSEISLYRLTLRKQYWKGYFGFEGFDEYLQLRTEKEKPLGSFGQLKKITNATFSEEREKWAERIKNENRNHHLQRAANWFSLALSLVALAFSVLWFNSWLSRKKTWRWLAAGFTVHLFFIYLFWNASMATMYILPTNVGLLLPGIWFYQLVCFVSRWYREKNT